MVGLGYTSLAGWGACVYCGGADRSAPPAAGASGAVQKGGWGGVLTSPNVPSLLLYLVTDFFTLGFSRLLAFGSVV